MKICQKIYINPGIDFFCLYHLSLMLPLDIHYSLHKPFGHEWEMQIIGIFLSPRAIILAKMPQSYPKQNLS
jgi:hypothetical protein